MADSKKYISLTDSRFHIADVVGSAQYANQATIVTRFGKPVAAVVSLEDFSLLQEVKRAKGKEGGEAKRTGKPTKEEESEGGWVNRKSRE